MVKKILLFFSFFFILNISDVYASDLQSCTNNIKYIDYTNAYQSMGNNQQLKQFYTDFKDWFDSQSDYQYYIILAQGGSDNLIHYYIGIYNNNTYYNYLTHTYSDRYRYIGIGVTGSANAYSNLRYINSTDLIFNSDNFVYGRIPTSNFSGGLNDSFSREPNTYHFTFDWIYSNTSIYTNGSLIFIDYNFIPTLADSSNFINLKVNDDYYCVTDSFPTLNSIYPLYIEDTPTPANEDLIYLPIEDFTNYDTYIYLDDNTIRAIKDNTCTDYNLLNHYNKIISSCENFDYSNYVVIDQQNLTNDFLYRLDISSFIILLLFMFLIVIFLPYYVFSASFRKRRF